MGERSVKSEERGTRGPGEMEIESYQPRLKPAYVVGNYLMYAMVPAACLYGFANEAHTTLAEGTVNVEGYVTLSFVLLVFSLPLLLFHLHVAAFRRTPQGLVQVDRRGVTDLRKDVLLPWRDIAEAKVLASGIPGIPPSLSVTLFEEGVNRQEHDSWRAKTIGWRLDGTDVNLSNLHRSIMEWHDRAERTSGAAG